MLPRVILPPSGNTLFKVAIPLSVIIIMSEFVGLTIFNAALTFWQSICPKTTAKLQAIMRLPFDNGFSIMIDYD